MKSLHITNAYHASSGGIATFYRALLRAALLARRSMSLIVPGPVSRLETLGPGVHIHHLQAPPAPFNPQYRWLLPHRYLAPNGDIRRILLQEKPDLVEICDKYTLNYLGGILRRGWIPGLPRPSVVALSCERMDENFAAYLGHSPAGRAFSRWYMKNLYFPMADHHVTVSPHTAAELRLAARGHAVSRGVWIRPMGVDAQLFSSILPSPETRNRLLAASGGHQDSILLLYAGRLAREKNLSLLTDTFALLRRDPVLDYRLIVVGDGAERHALHLSLSARCGPSFAILGHVPSRLQLASIYASSSVFLHPNPNEPFGIAPLEAMAASLPLVAPNSGGLLTYANQSNSFLAPPNPPAFAHAVRQAVEDPLARALRTANARSTALSYDWSVVAGRYLHLYSDIARSASQPDFLSTPGNWLGLEV